MKINVLTIFPGLFESFLNETLIKRAIESGKFEVDLIDIREYATDKHHTTDDTPYGGGPGMVMKVEPIFNALQALDNTMSSRTTMRDPQNVQSETTDSCLPACNALRSNAGRRGNGMSFGEGRKTVVLSPRGRQFSQSVVEEYAKLEEITLICGRYEGLDQRVVANLADEELSIGPYVMSGGEVPSMVVIEAVSRYLPGVLGNTESLKEETFSLAKSGNCLPHEAEEAKRGKLEIGNSQEYPQYTRPPEFNGWKVPEVLLSGNHEDIRKWRESKVK
jgi:tRNA (guanine37-N1)-methyltransferase